MTNSKASLLLKPFETEKLTIPTRLVMAPMTRKCPTDGIPGQDLATYFQKRVENGVGLILTGSAAIDHPVATHDPNMPHFYGEKALQEWGKIASAVHEVGGRIIPQLLHSGIFGDIANPAGPSGLAGPNSKVGEPMTEGEITKVVESFASSAANAKKLGFDGVEIHGAHGFLIDQFFWDSTNHRDDRYGGRTIEARTRFATEVIQACRHAVGPDFPILFRISQWKIQDMEAKLAQTPEALTRFLTPLVDAGVDIFDCSTLRFWEPEFDGSSLNLAGWTKKITGKPTITVGSVGLDNAFTSALMEGKGANFSNIDQLLEMLERQEFDLVAVGRALLADSEWGAKITNSQTDKILPFNIANINTVA